MTNARRLGRILFTDGFRAAPRAMSVTAVTTLMAAVAGVGYPAGIRVMVDALAHHDVAGEIAGVIVVAVLFTLSWALQIVSAVQGTGLSDRIKVWVSARIARLINTAPWLEHFERPDYLTEIELLEQRRQLLAAGPRQVLNLASIVVRTAGIAVLLALVYPPLALLPLVGLAPFLGDKQSVRIRERSDEKVAEAGRLAGELFGLACSAAPAKELRVFGLRTELTRRHDELTATVRRATTRAAIGGALCSGLGWLVYAAGFSGAIAIIAVRAARGEATAGQVVLAVSLLRRAQLTVSQVSNTVGQLVTSAATARRLIWLEDYAADAVAVEQGAETAVPGRFEHGITLADVAFTYPGTDVPVLAGVNLTLRAGTVVAVVGENGAGKTTLIKLLTGMYRPTSGAILLDGADLATMPIGDWRARTAAVFQDLVQWQLRAGQTVGIGDLPRLDDEDAILAALDRAAAGGIVGELADGLETPLGRTFAGGRDLSGGQWQKLALGRGMMRSDPLLLVLDEPTASLDAQTESELFTRYTDAARRAGAGGAVTVLVSHRFSTVRMADLIVVVDDGRVVEAGDHDTLVAAGGLYAELFELQAQAYR